MRVRHIVALLQLSVALVASTRTWAEDDAGWKAEAAADATFAVPAMGVEGLMRPTVIDVGPPYVPHYSAAADFADRVKDCVISCDPGSAELLPKMAFPLIDDCARGAGGCAAAGARVAMLPLDADAEKSNPWPAPNPMLMAPMAFKPGFGSPFDGCGCAPQDAHAAGERLEHILEAVRHLEAAGLDEDAQRVRSHADGDVRAVIEQLKAAMTELASVREPSGDRSQVIIDLQMVEVNLTKLRDFGCGLICETKVIEGDGFKDFVASIVKNGVGKVLCNPTLATVSGRRARVHIGSTVPVSFSPADDGPIDQKDIGSETSVLPVVLEDGKLRLEISSRFTEIDESRAVRAGNQVVPGFRVREACSSAEMKSGQTWVISGLVQKRAVKSECSQASCSQDSDCPCAGAEKAASTSPAEETQDFMLLVVVRPRILDADDHVKPASAEMVEPGMFR